MKNKRRRMRKFLVISLVVVILAVVTVFISTPFSPSLAQEESKEEESDYEKEPLMVDIIVTTEPDPPVLDSDHESVKITFEAEVSGGKSDSYEYKWSEDVEGSGESVTKEFEDPGTYKATVEVTSGEETASDTVSVEVLPPLEVSASASPSSGEAPLTVTFTASASGGTGSYIYKWTGTVSGDKESVTKTFEKARKEPYKATVTVTSGEQTESDSASVTVTKKKEEEEWTYKDWIKTFGKSVILSPGGTPVSIAEFALNPETARTTIRIINYNTDAYNEVDPTLSPDERNPWEDTIRWQDGQSRPDPSW